MKKGLLGLLVVALTIVGCQNYDDQFDDLNSKISSLASTVDDLLTVQTAVSELSTKLDNLASTALTDADLQSVLTEVNAVKQDVADLSLADDLAGIETEVADLDAEVDEILEKLNELLTANAVINQNVRITSLAELSLAMDLISTGTDDPNVTINGSLVVSTAGNSDITSASAIASLTLVLSKIKVVMKTVTISTDEALTAASLQYIQGDLDIAAPSGSLTAGALTTVTGAMSINQGGDLLMPLLNSVAGGITIDTSNVTVTSVDFSGLTEGAARTGAGELALPNATSVKISGVLPTTVNCPAATTFVSNSTAAQTASTITVDGSTDFSLGSSTFSGQVTITATGDVKLAGVTSAKGLSVTSGGSIDLGGLTGIVSATSISASTTVDLGSLASIAATTVVTGTSVDLTALATTAVGADVTLNGPTSVSAPALTTLGGNIVAASATSFAAITLATTTGTVDIADDATAEFGDLSDPTDLVDFAGIKILKLHAQETTLDYSTAVSITALTVLGKQKSPIAQDGQTNDVILTNANTLLADLTIGGTLRTVSLDNTALTAFASVDGSTILDLQLLNNADLATVALAHDRLDGERALGITVVNNDKLQELDMSTVNKIKEITITGNASLTSIVMAGFTPAVEPTASITVTISGNNLPGEYTSATAGTDTTPYLEASITDGSGIICGVKAFIDYYDAAKTTGSVTATVDLDDVDLYTQEENADDVVVRTISSPLVNQALSAHIAADGNATGFGGATDAIDSPADFALIGCE
jgi:hypothetical protein